MAKRAEGLSSGWKGPVNEYVRNKGSVGKKRIVFIGASYGFVHRVFRDLILVGGFNDAQVVVHDIDEVPLKLVADLIERIARQQKTKIRIFRTLDRKEALAGADAVILSITTGGRESDFRAFEVCAKYGIPVGIGDTMGPPALARNLREIPVVREIVHDMERICPSAVLLNFTNPMSCITGAMARLYPGPVWGLCHSADGLAEYFAGIFKVKKSKVDMRIAGVNHQSFVTSLRIAGRDRTPEILERSAGKGVIEDRLLATSESVDLQRDVCRILGLWPSCGGSHLAEFYRFFFTSRRLVSLGFDQQLKRIIPGRQPFGRKTCPEILRQWAYGPKKVGDLHLLTEEHAHELLWAYFTGQPFTRALNVLNTGDYIRNLPRNACVEIMATVAGQKVTAEPVTLPPAIHAVVSNWTTIHDLSIAAALNHDRDAARQALFLDPHVGDMHDIAPLLEDMLLALKDWLPGAWFDKPSGARKK